ncbi:serine/threonine protein kinase [Crocosphaera subtropica ATCC 51142]|uniref:non-specific serine/threonine protein kinase n=1 Tax=Crocosphaera subtropica (strain ATCC 51142 / BH68) TaxID=43989 RepID=B1WVW6_CROS5|nr:serine/threonine-protein kinase [Crocosphaera subtropica]ACB52299.1 serine/threonine protein kinase [Crocosphaera subtropica ATCC 51142]
MSLLLNNRYQVIETLGKGGFGETFLAIDTHMPSERKCVIKQLKPAVQSPVIPDWLKERFAKEAAILEELGEKHPQIPTLYAYFSEGGDFYLVQEWIEGETLTQIHQRQGNLSPNQVREILIGILPVLDYIHSRRIIHRDIKPDNIIIRSHDKKPVLIDFGIVKETVATMIHGDGNTPYSVGLGTPGYMASEQAAGRPLNSSDLYSLGLTMVFLLTGKTPQYLATDPNTGEVLWRKEAPDIQSNVGNVIDRAVRFHPRDRFSTAKEMLEALQVPHTIPTAATIAIGQQNLSLSRSSTHTPIPTNLPAEATETETDTPWALLALGSFLAASAIIGGLMLGIMLGTKERSQPTSSPSVSPESPEVPENSQPEFSQPRPTLRRPVRRSPGSQSSPTLEATPTPTLEPSPTLEATPTPTLEPSPNSTVQPSPTPKASPSPTSTPIPEPTKVVPIPVEPPPQVSEPKEPTNQEGSEPSLVIPHIPPKPAEEKPPKEEENKQNIQKYFESDREQNKSNLQQYFDSDRP